MYIYIYRYRYIQTPALHNILNILPFLPGFLNNSPIIIRVPL